MKAFYAVRGFENRYIVRATSRTPTIVSMTSILADTTWPTLSANTSLTTRNTEKPLSVAR
jgi:hypothetical protein